MCKAYQMMWFINDHKSSQWIITSHLRKTMQKSQNQKLPSSKQLISDRVIHTADKWHIILLVSVMLSLCRHFRHFIVYWLPLTHQSVLLWWAHPHKIVIIKWTRWRPCDRGMFVWRVHQWSNECLWCSHRQLAAHWVWFYWIGLAFVYALAECYKSMLNWNKHPWVARTSELRFQNYRGKIFILLILNTI